MSTTNPILENLFRQVFGPVLSDMEATFVQAVEKYQGDITSEAAVMDLKNIMAAYGYGRRAVLRLDQLREDLFIVKPLTLDGDNQLILTALPVQTLNSYKLAAAFTGRDEHGQALYAITIINEDIGSVTKSSVVTFESPEVNAELLRQLREVDLEGSLVCYVSMVRISVPDDQPTPEAQVDGPTVESEGEQS